MTKLLTTLEEIAQDASLQSPDALKTYLENADLSEQEKLMILEQDSEAIAAELDVKKDIVCLVIVPAEDDEEQEGGDEEQEDTTTSNKLVSNG